MVFQAIASAFERDELGVMEEAIQDGGGGGDIADELAPVFDGTVGGHQGRAIFVPSQDDLEEVLPGFRRQSLGAHVVDDQEIRLEILGQDFGMALEVFVLQEVADHVENGTVEHDEARADDGQSDRLGQMAFAGYAASGIVGTMPSPGLCRATTRLPSMETPSDTA